MPEGIGERRRVAAASESAAAACSATARCLRSPPCCGPHGRRMGTGGRASLPRALHGCRDLYLSIQVFIPWADRRWASLARSSPTDRID